MRQCLMVFGEKRGMESKLTALIISRPGQLRNSLEVLLAAIPQLEAVRPADDSQAALVIGTQCHPALVVMDYDRSNDSAAALGYIKSAWPQTRCVVLADDEQVLPAAWAAGADIVLTKGVLASKFYATIEELLSNQDAEACSARPDSADLKQAAKAPTLINGKDSSC